MHALPFIGSRGARTLSGAPTGGPDILLNNVQTLEPLTPRYRNLPLQLLPIVLSIEKLMCVSTTRVWSCVTLPAQCLLSAACTVEDMLSLLDQFPLIGEWAMLTCCTVASAHTVAAYAADLLQQIIITLCSCARRCYVTIRRPRARSTVM
jgi:hypothetical protein